MGGPRYIDIEQRAVARICLTHNLDRKDFIRCQVDVRSGLVKFAFKAPHYTDEAKALANEIHDLLNDALRGEVARTVSPALSVKAMALTDLILNPKPRIITMHRDELLSYV